MPDLMHEFLPLEFDLLEDFFDILLDGEQVSLDAFLLEVLDLVHLPLRSKLGPGYDSLDLARQVLEELGEEHIRDGIRQLFVVRNLRRWHLRRLLWNLVKNVLRRHEVRRAVKRLVRRREWLDVLRI